MEDSLIPCAGTLGFFLILFAFIMGLRYLNYRETLALAEKGLVKPQPEKDNKSALKVGIIIAGIGLALVIGLLPLGWGPGSDYPLGFGPWMLAGLLPLFFGLALILIHVLTYKDEEKNGKE
jgi:sterol desaturase/sphingolipid hydroxylase (fatty acid hydroxylase superfamily)